jgi:hypothetical protein
MPKELENLCFARQCFYCQEQGHMANQCPCHPQRVNAVEASVVKEENSSSVNATNIYAALVNAPMPPPVSDFQ